MSRRVNAKCCTYLIFLVLFLTCSVLCEAADEENRSLK